MYFLVYVYRRGGGGCRISNVYKLCMCMGGGRGYQTFKIVFFCVCEGVLKLNFLVYGRGSGYENYTFLSMCIGDGIQIPKLHVLCVPDMNINGRRYLNFKITFFLYGRKVEY